MNNKSILPVSVFMALLLLVAVLPCGATNAVEWYQGSVEITSVTITPQPVIPGTTVMDDLKIEVAVNYDTGGDFSVFLSCGLAACDSSDNTVAYLGSASLDVRNKGSVVFEEWYNMMGGPLPANTAYISVFVSIVPGFVKYDRDSSQLHDEVQIPVGGPSPPLLIPSFNISEVTP